MKRKICFLILPLFLVACATHSPAPEPQGELFPINKKTLIKKQELIQKKIEPTNNGNS